MHHRWISQAGHHTSGRVGHRDGIDYSLVMSKVLDSSARYNKTKQNKTKHMQWTDSSVSSSRISPSNSTRGLSALSQANHAFIIILVLVASHPFARLPPFTVFILM